MNAWHWQGGMTGQFMPINQLLTEASERKMVEKSVVQTYLMLSSRQQTCFSGGAALIVTCHRHQRSICFFLRVCAAVLWSARCRIHARRICKL